MRCNGCMTGIKIEFHITGFVHARLYIFLRHGHYFHKSVILYATFGFHFCGQCRIHMVSYNLNTIIIHQLVCRIDLC